MLQPNFSENFHQARKLLWAFLLLFAVATFAYQWYEDRQIISNFAAEGIIIKINRATQEQPALIDIVDENAHLRRLSHKNLILGQDLRVGDAFYKEAGTVTARINQQLVDLQ
ncbi:MAG: hypothetical protein HRU20_22500 [Pseudomonadales bacterium]|nr:hypothetical protein [Pseudomonadales bacterium]